MAYNIVHINPLDLQPSKGIGIQLPFNGPTGLNITYTTKDAIKSNILNFLPRWTKQINDTIIWPSFRRNIVKYTPFIHIEKEKYKNLLREILYEN